jgi:hypothetical protein
VADDAQGAVSRSWPELLAGALLGLFVAGRFGVDGNGALAIAAVGAFLAYLAGCAFFPMRVCWRCRGKGMMTDGRGNMRERPCFRCKRRRVLRRPGAVLIGAVGRRE